jgi:hypothetical protein
MPRRRNPRARVAIPGRGPSDASLPEKNALGATDGDKETMTRIIRIVKVYFCLTKMTINGLGRLVKGDPHGSGRLPEFVMPGRHGPTPKTLRSATAIFGVTINLIRPDYAAPSHLASERASSGAVRS